MIPMVRWIAAEIKPILRSLHHILADSTRKLRLIKLDPDTVFMKIDIDSYIMSGEKEILLDHASENIRPCSMNIFRKALSYILDAQFVSPDPPGSSDNVYQVTKGSGMGMTSSGEVADLAYYNLVEKNWVLDENTKTRFS